MCHAVRLVVDEKKKKAKKAGLNCGLNFPRGGLICFHADLRISLRKVRVRQRIAGALERLEGFRMPALRVKETGQEIFNLRGGSRRQQPGKRRKEPGWRPFVR
jgi:hypothetical protein